MDNLEDLAKLERYFTLTDRNYDFPPEQHKPYLFGFNLVLKRDESTPSISEFGDPNPEEYPVVLGFVLQNKKQRKDTK